MVLILLALLLAPALGRAVPIGPGDFAPGSTLLTFDEFANGTFLSNEFAAQKVVFGSGPTPDGLNGGGTPAPFVAIENEFPLATASAPNKIIGTIEHPLQGLIKCGSCAVVATLLGPIPTQVGFWVSDPDLGQFAEFFGPSGLLATITVTTGNSGAPFFIGFEDSGGINQIILHSTAGFGVGLDNFQFGAPVPEPSTAALALLGLVTVGAARQLTGRHPPDSAPRAEQTKRLARFPQPHHRPAPAVRSAASRGMTRASGSPARRA
ncbi:MAG TPA: PEP-CTERM sorting domain-containing protein [Myxococcota bacterium]|jgi:hypothetical protein|nr:PEP-CTERM sorting domain-containing protein [Myxococcota bacterium]